MVKGLVLDCSIVTAWFFKDEYRLEINQLQEKARDEGAIVPAHWYFEVVNAFRQAERRQRVTENEVLDYLNSISEMPIKPDDFPSLPLAKRFLSLSRTHALTIYDAAYLELAIRRGVPLATKDEDLRTAAQKADVQVLP